MVDIIKLQAPGLPRATIGEQLGRIKDLPTPVRILASPKLTGGLVTGLGILTGGIGVLGKSVLTGLAVPTLAGLFKASPRAEKAIVGRITSPEKLGESIGEFIEEPKKKIAKVPPLVAGLIGAGAVVGGADIIRKVKKGKIKVPAIISGEKEITGVLPILPEGQFTPLAPVEKPKEEKVIEPTPIVPMEIKNVFKPSIDISFKKSKRFINQQINVR